MSLEHRMRYWRQMQKLSQADLAEKSGVGKNTVQKIEQGVHKPNYVTIEKLCRALGIDPNTFFAWFEQED